MNISALLELGRDRLQAAGIEAAGLESRLLLAAVLGLETSALLMHEDEDVSPGNRALFEDWLERRVQSEPLQHIIGQTEFYGLSLHSDKRALIPRPDTECLVDLALETIAEDADIRLADLGTGSGCILLALLSRLPQATGLGLDKSSAALDLARENAARHSLSGRIDFICQDWIDWTGWAEFDVIVSNPPYIASPELSELDPVVRDHDPVMALDGGADGLIAYRQLISAASRSMRSGTKLLLEIGHDQLIPVRKMLDMAGFKDICARQDLGGRDRVLSACLN